MENIKDTKKITIVLFVLAITSLLAAMFFIGYYKYDVKRVISRVIIKSKNFVYYEATIHNPEGNFLPDWIDDIILGKAKEIFK